MSEKTSEIFTRKVEGYLKPTNHKFFKDYVNNQQISKSEAVNDAVKALREKLNPDKPKQ